MKIKMSQSLEKQCLDLRMMGVLVIAEEKGVCNRGLHLALSFMPAGLHMLLSMPTLSI